ncbi:hypothetical protein [Acidisphaera sp. S103]|uniref:hypothetical protein n=1 Tax=Acidisphaera sp. S103 TaxID=1747223 RepID=UPI00131D4B31|nr:hypothetical protein [Acidisphaera sp. S103]
MSHANDDGLDDAEVRDLDAEEQRRVLLTWFRARYVAPEDHRLLINHQYWLSNEYEEAPDAFANSDEEPVDALDVITARFSHILSNELLNKIAGELENTATHWFRINDVDVYREHEEKDLMRPRRRHSTAENQRIPITESSDPTLIFTPRFPNGITLTDLRSQSSSIQKETMLAWFLATHVPATGTYFGFSGLALPSAVLNTSMLGTFAPNQPRIAGFGQGTFFNGGRATELLTKVFRPAVASNVIEEVAALFEGLWERRPEISESASTHAEVLPALIATLDALEADVRKFSPEHGGIGHNRPPEDELPITSEGQVSTLQAIEEMRLAVSSGSDHSVVEAAWHGISQITTKLGSWALKQANVFINGMVEEGGKAVGKKLPYLIGVGFSAWYFGNNVPHLLERLIDILK